MKITSNWLKEHLDTKLNENQIINKLTDIGLEVESINNQSSELDSFIVAKILRTEKHPDADRLKVCDVDIGLKDPVTVVCGAPNAKDGLITIYAPPGAVIPKTKFELKIAKIRGVESKGMLFDFKRSRVVNMWMRNTFIPLDMIFISNSGKVQRIYRDAQPHSEDIISSEYLVRAVLEVSSGTADRIGLRVGDQILHSIFQNK